MNFLKDLLSEKLGDEKALSATRVIVLTATAFALGAGITALTASLLSDVITTAVTLDYFKDLFMYSAGAYVGGQIGKGVSSFRSEKGRDR